MSVEVVSGVGGASVSSWELLKNPNYFFCCAFFFIIFIKAWQKSHIAFSLNFNLCLLHCSRDGKEGDDGGCRESLKLSQMEQSWKAEYNKCRLWCCHMEWKMEKMGTCTLLFVFCFAPLSNGYGWGHKMGGKPNTPLLHPLTPNGWFIDPKVSFYFVLDLYVISLT